MYPTREQLRTACEALCARDDALARAYSTLGVPEWRIQPASYEALARTVVYQLISTKAADAIWARVCDWAAGDLSPQRVMNATEDELRGCGLSRPKVRHLTTIAEAIATQSLDIALLHDMPDAEARKHLTAVKGIGPWTAELFLMCSLGRINAFPEGDVGLMESLRLLSQAEDRLTAKAFLTHAESWRPYRGVAAHLLWGYINHLRGNAR